jgi:predicted nucleic acid-binding protein
MTVFLDTYALIAWVHTRDAAHPTVKSYLDAYSGRIVTTEWVLVEFADAFAKAVVKPHALSAIQRIRRLPMFDVVAYSPAVFQAGFDLFAARPDKDWSLTDCISFAVMTEHGLTDALTADHHFEQAGFRALFKTS